MNAAQKFLYGLASQDSNTVYKAVKDAADRGEIEESQDWEDGKSTWTFDDESAIVMQGSDVTVRNRDAYKDAFSRDAWYSDAYNTGFEACIQGEPREDNPYHIDAVSRDAWYRGWDDAK